MKRSFMTSVLLLVSVCGRSYAWPSRYTDCRAFPMLGEPQKRFQGHPSVGLKCDPRGDTTFEWCMQNCAVENSKQTCDETKCTCEEKCFADPLECAQHGSGLDSESDALSARSGGTTFLVDGQVPSSYTPGATHSITVVPAASSTSEALETGVADLQRAGSSATHLLLDVGAGVLSEVGSVANWQATCDGTRAGFKASESVELDWAAPDGQESVILRVAAATSKGDITVNAVTLKIKDLVDTPPSALNVSSSAQGAYACTVAEGYTHQCLRVPASTPGATDEASCTADCAPHRCANCKHVYFPSEDGDGLAFEALPESWTCPMCGALKSTFSKALPAVRSTASVSV